MIMSIAVKAVQKNVISLEKYRGERRQKPHELGHEQVIGDPDPPTARVWLQGGAPQASLENIRPENAGQLLFVALSMCLELAVIAQRSGMFSQALDISS
jgi:hypothetical protein